MAKKKSEALVPEVLGVLEQEVGLVLEDSTIVQRFAAGVRAFFKRAQELELKAKTNLEQAKLLTAPKTREEDERLQFTIKAFGADKKEALEHWDVALKVGRFHKRLTAGRDRAETPNEQAVKLATNLHNQYVAEEGRRVAAENERLRREAEQRAAEDRKRELAEMERQAAEKELASEQLSDRERKFVAQVASGQHPENAAKFLGYKDPAGFSSRLMGLVKIVDAIKAAREAAAIREQAAAKKEEPIHAQFHEVEADVSKAGGTDRSTHSAELFDERLLIEAIVGGRHGIPLDILTVKPAKLNDYARSMHELINRWPGVKYKKTTSLV